MKKNIFVNALLIFSALAITISCKKTTPAPAPTPTPARVCQKALSISYVQSNLVYNAVNFQANTSSPDFVSYSWNFGDGSNSVSQSPQHNYPLSNSTYTVSYKAVTACGDTVKKDTTITISNVYTYQFKCDNYAYQLTVQGDGTTNVQDAGDVNGTFPAHYLHCVIGNNQFGINQSYPVSNKTFSFDFSFGQTTVTAYGAPPVGTYNQANCGADLTYNNFTTSISVVGDYAGMVGGQATPGSAAQVILSRSDTVVIGTFNFSLIGTNLDPPSSCNGSFQASRYKRYY